MKKATSVMCVMSLMVSAAIAFSGCSASTKASSSAAETQASAAAGPQKQMDTADLSGEVYSITGSNIVLKLIETQTFGKGGGQPGDKSGIPSQPSGTQKENKGTDKSGAQPKQMTENYTGETKTITVGDEVAITTFVTDANGGDLQTIAVKDIKQGDILQVWYSDDNKETISRISVRAAIGQYGGKPGNQGGASITNGTDSTTK